MNKTPTGLMITAALLLAGCDESQNAQDGAAHLVSVLPSGFQINDHGKRAYILGESRCPDSTQEGCIIVNDQVSTVAVSVWTYGTGAPRTEAWKIERSGAYTNEMTRLKRPDNSDVQP
ncbi:hypothetical protein [Erwinia tasmaniensis]|uniref:Lipoprotein n=1 Tax=Erwinia tasmaniensis (strain DSM 17950 / CFBP 7177 / CIP 109463 / NCPPB 4357 / Et1/99) TaxID=465817 RepID=B2VB42_ERWT9|nr:hypothetical protein [Erwinia tasmaniensis]CAO94978.1 Hypothetical protein ETA_pET450340 [Erwinia tasmaniensis Et1/99]